MSRPSYEEIIARISGYGDREPIGIVRDLLHGYVGLLTFDEVITYTLQTLDVSSAARRAVHGRVVRGCLGGEASDAQVTVLGEGILNSTPSASAGRRTRDSLLSQIYLTLSPDLRSRVLEHWQGRKGKDAAARWLKAISSDPLHFDDRSVLTYWIASADDRAAKILAYQARPEVLQESISDLIERCSWGWVVSKAALRVTSLSEDNWERIRARFPSTYAYLCAKLNRSLDATEAALIFKECDPFDGSQGLTMWAFGRLGLWSALDAVARDVESFVPIGRGLMGEDKL